MWIRDRYIRLRFRDPLGRNLRSRQLRRWDDFRHQKRVIKVTLFCFAGCYAMRVNIGLTESRLGPTLALPPF
jgi:hypothetical protein